jgi:hypothetical protein
MPTDMPPEDGWLLVVDVGVELAVFELVILLVVTVGELVVLELVLELELVGRPYVACAASSFRTLNFGLFAPFPAATPGRRSNQQGDTFVHAKVTKE